MGVWLKASLATAALISCASACSSHAQFLGPQPPPDYKAGEMVHGSACGLLLFGIIPIQVNTRTERAYEQAVGTHLAGLTDTQIRYSWYIIPCVGLYLCTDVEGRLIQ